MVRPCLSAEFFRSLLGLFPARLLVIATLVALIEIPVATLAGAWLYKEKEEQASAVRRATA